MHTDKKLLNEMNAENKQQREETKLRIQKQIPPKLHQSNIQQYDELYQQPTKVMRSSNSEYDGLLDQFYQDKNNNLDVKSYSKGKSPKDFKHQISFIRNLQVKSQFIAYCIVTKESSSGFISHERFIVLDSQRKQLKYYSQIPQLPLKTVEDLGDEAKEVIHLNYIKKFDMRVAKQGIGEIELDWVEQTGLKKWKIKMANNSMAKELAGLIQEVRTGKKFEDKSKSKSIVKVKALSPRSNIVTTVSHFSSKMKKSQVNVQPNNNNNNLANLLLRSIAEPEQKNQEIQLPVRKKKSEVVTTQFVDKMIEEPEQRRKVSLPSNPKIEVKSDGKPNIEIRQVKPQIKVYNPPIQDAIAKNLTHEIQQIVKKEPSLNKKTFLSITKKQQSPNPNHQRYPSIQLEDIIKNASIQRLQYKELSKTNQARNATPKFVPANHSSSRLSKLQEMVKHKRSLDDSRQSSSKEVIHKGLQLSKVIVKNIDQKSNKNFRIQQSFKNIKAQQKSTVNPQTSGSKYQTPSNRDYLLNQRKYANTYYDSKNSNKKAKVINQHSHPIKQRGRSKSFSNQIDDYVTQQKSSREWLVRWLRADSQIKRGEIYKKFVDKCIEKVKNLSKTFENWHLFHKPGEQYITKSQQIQFTYRMFSSNERIDIQKQDNFEYKMGNLQYLWHCMNEISYQSGQVMIGIPLACIVTFQGLRVFCKLDLQSSNVEHHFLADLEQYQGVLTKLSKISKTYLRNASVYHLTIVKKQYIYVDQAQLKPYLLQSDISLNQNYLKTYVEGVISSQNHLLEIQKHVTHKLMPQILMRFQKYQPLTCLQLEQTLYSYGVDSSILSDLYKQSDQKSLKCANKLILSSLCAQILTDEILRLFHKIILTKSKNKNIKELIYGILAKVLRFDSDQICQELLIKKKVVVTLNQLKDRIMDEYIISSIFIKLGIRCNIKTKIKLQDLESMPVSFWNQFQFTQSSINIHFEPRLQTFSAQHFNPHSSFLQTHVFNPSKDNNKISKQILYGKLNTPLESKYAESDSFILLDTCHKEKVSNFIAQQEIPVNGNQSLWTEQYFSPFFHLYHFTNSYFYSYHSFLKVLNGIRWFMDKKQYKKAESIITDQLFRAWIWGKSNPHLIMEIYDIYALIKLFLNRQVQCLEGCLVSLQIGIKTYEIGQLDSEILLEKTHKAASIHAKYSRCNRAIQLFSTCESLFEGLIDNGRGNVFLETHLNIYNQKAELFLKLGQIKIASQHLRSVLIKLFTFKQRCQGQPQSQKYLTYIFDEQFQTYSLLFRIYELQSKKIQMLQLMQQCSCKFIQNYIEILLKNKRYFSISDVTENCRRYFRQIIKNIWIAIIINCSQWRIQNYQHYFNQYYAPLKEIQLATVRNIIMEIRKAGKGRYPIDKEEAINHCFGIIATSINKYQQRKDTVKTKPKSILVVAILDCLSILSESKTQTKPPTLKSQQIHLLQSLLVTTTYEFSIGTIDSCINNFNSQF